MKNKAVRKAVLAGCTLFSILLFSVAFAGVGAMAIEIAESVQGAGHPIAGAKVKLYAAGTGAPAQVVITPSTAINETNQHKGAI